MYHAQVRLAVKKYTKMSWLHLEWGQYLPHGYNLNKLGRGLLGHVTYLISRF